MSAWRVLACFCVTVVCIAQQAIAFSSDSGSSVGVSGGAVVNAAGLVALDAFGDHSIRIRVAPAGSSIVDPQYRALLAQPPSSSPVASIRAVLSGLTTSQSSQSAAASASGVASDSALPVQAASLTNGNLRVDVDSNGLLTATRLSDGAVLLKQTSVAFGPALVSGPAVSALAASATVSFAGTVGEKIYGLGEHKNGKLNQQGFTADFRDSHFYPKSYGGDVIIPYYASSSGYGFCWVTASYGNVSFSEQQISWGLHAAANVDMWITTTAASPSASSSSFYLELLSHFADAVGHASPLPFYTTGFWQSKDRYRNQTQLLSIAREYIRRQIPLSVIVVDFFHWKNFGDWAFNPLCWPDPQSMVDELRQLGVELAVTFWPYLTQSGAYFQPFSDAGYLWKDRYTNKTAPVESWADPSGMFLVDETNPAAQAAEFDAFWKGYGQYGIKTIWIDATEPERLNDYNFGQFVTQNGNTDMESAEAWIRAHEQGLHEGMLSKGYSVGDFALLARSAWAGTWAYSSIMWSGDTQSTFTELSNAVRIAQTTALSGIAVWTTDTGGFSGGDPTNPLFQELIVRWFQFSAFCPVFRLHGQRNGGEPADSCGDTYGPNEVWTLAADEVHYDAIVAMVRLREQLRQYVVLLNKDTVQTGMPMVRPLFIQFPNDSVIASDAAETLSSQYMFGPDWLVAPVTVSGAQNQTVYLPVLESAQQRWTYWFDPTQMFAGGQFVTLPTPINAFPLFVRTPSLLWSVSLTGTVQA